MNLENFLDKSKNPNQEDYDFKNEISQLILKYTENKKAKKCVLDIDDRIEVCRNILAKGTDNPIAMLVEYKIFSKRWKGRFDCDSCAGQCNLTDEIYQKLWGWNYNLNKSNRHKVPDDLLKQLNPEWETIGIGSDTMNTFATLYAFIMEKLYLDDFQRVGYKFKQNSYVNYAKCKEEFANLRINKEKTIQDYAKYTHTIGNFCLIPFKLCGSYFQSRGFSNGKLGVFDYWDFSLLIIKAYFKDIPNGFKNYVNTFYLKPYFVDDNYRVKQLFTRDSTATKLFENQDNNTIEEIVNCKLKHPLIETVLQDLFDLNRIIKLRGEFLIKKIKDQ